MFVMEGVVLYVTHLILKNMPSLLQSAALALPAACTPPQCRVGAPPMSDGCVLCRRRLMDRTLDG